jgi:y4mF family transcriptional regulator
MALTTHEIGTLARETRKKMKVTQRDLALTSGTGLRFLIELEKGKETCQIGKVLTVLQTLEIRIQLVPPAATDGKE